jgi:hypothetical protein
MTLDAVSLANNGARMGPETMRSYIFLEIRSFVKEGHENHTNAFWSLGYDSSAGASVDALDKEPVLLDVRAIAAVGKRISAAREQALVQWIRARHLDEFLLMLQQQQQQILIGDNRVTIDQQKPLLQQVATIIQARCPDTPYQLPSSNKKSRSLAKVSDGACLLIDDDDEPTTGDDTQQQQQQKKKGKKKPTSQKKRKAVPAPNIDCFAMTLVDIGTVGDPAAATASAEQSQPPSKKRRCDTMGSAMISDDFVNITPESDKTVVSATSDKTRAMEQLSVENKRRQEEEADAITLEIGFDGKNFKSYLECLQYARNEVRTLREAHHCLQIVLRDKLGDAKEAFDRGYLEGRNEYLHLLSTCKGGNAGNGKL